MSKYDQKFKFKANKPLKRTHIELFEKLNKIPDSQGEVEQKLLILCTPRCGSTLFADALSNTGKIGMCEEWFNYEYFGAYSKVRKCDFSLKEYLDWIATKTIGNTGVFSLKLHIGQIVTAAKDFEINFFDFGFDSVVYLYRKDKIAQAVSLAKAMKSDQFRYNEDAKEIEGLTCHEIAYTLGIIIEQDEYFKDNYDGIPHYAYEDFVDLNTPHCSYNKILDDLGKAPVNELEVTLKKQRDAYSKEMINKFKNYISGE